MYTSFMVQKGEPAMTTNLGDLISTIYDEFLAQYKDEELASIATAAVINDLLLNRAAPEA